MHRVVGQAHPVPPACKLHTDPQQLSRELQSVHVSGGFCCNHPPVNRQTFESNSGVMVPSGLRKTPRMRDIIRHRGCTQQEEHFALYESCHLRSALVFHYL